MADTESALGVLIEPRKQHAWRERDYLRSYIGSGWEDYIVVYDAMKKSGSPFSWSWSAFLWPIPWMAYRKLYVPALVAWVALNLLLMFVDINQSVSYWLYCLAFGLMGKALYIKCSLRKIENLVRLAPSEADSVQQVMKAGGTSDWAVVVAFVAPMLINIALLIILH